jgi:transposase-like protein
MVLVPHVIEGFKSGLVKEYLRNSGLDYWKFLGLSLGSTSRSIQPFVDMSYVAIWYWIQEFDPKHVYPNQKKNRIAAFIIDETQIQIGSNEAWLWVAIELFLVFMFRNIQTY